MCIFLCEICGIRVQMDDPDITTIAATNAADVGGEEGEAVGERSGYHYDVCDKQC